MTRSAVVSETGIVPFCRPGASRSCDLTEELAHRSARSPAKSPR